MKLIDSISGWFNGKDDNSINRAGTSENQTGSQSPGISIDDTAVLQHSSGGTDANSQVATGQKKSLWKFFEENCTSQDIVSQFQVKIPKATTPGTPGMQIARSFLDIPRNLDTIDQRVSSGKTSLQEIEKTGTPKEQLLAKTALEGIGKDEYYNSLGLVNFYDYLFKEFAGGVSQKKPIEILAGFGKVYNEHSAGYCEEVLISEAFLKKIEDIGGPEVKTLCDPCNTALSRLTKTSNMSGIPVFGATFNVLSRDNTGVTPGQLLGQIAKEASKEVSSHEITKKDANIIFSVYADQIENCGTPTEKLLVTTSKVLLGNPSPVQDFTSIRVANGLFSFIGNGVGDEPPGRSLAKLAADCMKRSPHLTEGIKLTRPFIDAICKVGTPDELLLADFAQTILANENTASPVMLNSVMQTIFGALSRDDFDYARDIEKIIQECKATACDKDDLRIIENCIYKKELEQTYQTLQETRDGSGDYTVKHDEAEVNIDGATLKKRKARFSLIQEQS